MLRHTHTQQGHEPPCVTTRPRSTAKSQTWALADGRDHVIPDDIKDLSVPVLCHRLILDAEAQFNGVTVEQVISQLLDDIAPPAERVA